MFTYVSSHADWIYKNRELVSIVSNILIAITLSLLFLLSPFKPEIVVEDMQDILAILEYQQPIQEVKTQKQSVIPNQETSTDSSKKSDVLSAIDKKSQQTEVKSNLPLNESALEQNSSQSATLKNTNAGSQIPSLSQIAPSQNSSNQQSLNANAIYEAALKEYIEKIKRYPTSRDARLSRPEGTVRIFIELGRRGDLLSYSVVNTSGSNLLDMESLRTIKGGSYSPFPDEAFVGETTHKFFVNMKYHLITNLSNN